MSDIRTLSKHIASHQAALAIEKAKENVILLIDGFAGHKLLSVDCQYIDVVEGELRLIAGNSSK